MFWLSSQGKSRIRSVVLSLVMVSMFFAEQESVPSSNTNENRQFLHGMVSVVKSLDTYLKGTYNYTGLVGENSEVNGDLYWCDFVMMSQYPSKADGYIRYYAKTGFLEYKELSQQIIDKMYKVYKNTRDRDGNLWLPTGHFISKDGKFYGYSKGKKFTRYSENPIPYDQSNGEYQIEGAGMADSWGIGMFELSKMVDYLDPVYKEKLIELNYGMADFWNRDYMLYRKQGMFFYRTEDVTPSNPKYQKDELKFWCIGLDLLYSIVSLQQLGQNTDKYDERLILLMQTYVKDRPSHNKDFRIDYLDSRMIELSKYFKNKGKEKELSDWVFKRLPGLYKDQINKARFMLNGDVRGSSTIPLLDLYAQLNMKAQYRELWQDIWDNHFGELGIKNEEENVYLSVNNSGYALLLDAGYQGWLTGMISDEEFNKAIKKYYEFKGDRRNYRDCDDWVIETEEWDKKNSNWQATPFDCYPEIVESEHYYFGKPQGFTVNRMVLSGEVKEAMKKENQKRNCYYQFVAPFENHAEKERYGLAQTFNVLDTHVNAAIKIDLSKDGQQNNPEFIIKYKEPKVSKGMPCSGFVDVTELYYKDKKEAIKEGFEVSEVQLNGKKIPYQVFHLLDYKEPYSRENNAKLGFIIETEGNEKENEIKIITAKRNFPYYIVDDYYNENSSKTKPKDLPVVEKQNQTSTVDTFTLKDAVKAGRYVSNWEQWCLAYKSGDSKNKKELETAIKETARRMEEGDFNRNRLVELVVALTRIYYVNEDKSKEELAKSIEKYSNDVLNEKETPKGVNILRDGEMLIRYGILFPERLKAKESLDFGWEKVKKYLKENFNEEGFDKYTDPIEDVKILTEIERLCLINDVKIPDEIFSKTEKIIEFLMYCGNPDGTISEFIDKSKGNIREWLYWGSKIYKRTDFRYVAFGGLLMENCFEPEKTSIAYEKSGVYVMRNGWDIRDRYLTPFFHDEDKEKRQVVYTITEKGEDFSAYNRKLGIKKAEQKIVKWVTKENYDYLEVIEKSGRKRKITYVKPDYWFVNVVGCPYKLEDEMKIIKQYKTDEKNEEMIRSEHKYEEDHLYGLSVKEKGEILVQQINGELYLMHCYHNDSRKRITVEVDENYKRKKDEVVYKYLYAKGVPPKYMKMMSYVPEIKVSRKGDNWTINYKDKEKIEIGNFGENVIINRLK